MTEPRTPARREVAVRFYVTSAGTEPVRDWLRDMDRELRRRIGEDIKTVQLTWPVGPPLVKSLKDGLWEVRTSTTAGEARVLFAFHEQSMVLLHGFWKKTPKTPKNELDTARSRLKSLG